MGYTHYWRRPERLEKRIWARFTADVKRIILTAVTDDGIPIVDAWGRGGDPVVDSDLVSFNGKAPDDGFETFHIPRVEEMPDWQRERGDKLVFNFTKTARNRYDKVVVACLVALKYHYGSRVVISSDGDWGEWQDGLDLCYRATGFKLDRLQIGIDPAQAA